MSGTVRTILQVNTRDRRGGAEQVALNLHRGFSRRNLQSYLAVGHRHGNEPGVLSLPADARPRTQSVLAHHASGAARVIDRLRGAESFHYPLTYQLPDIAPHTPDIIHLHNLHGGYFDLRALSVLDRYAPLVLTLHDAWLLSGHCSHSFDCMRWQSGCGHCPDLTIYPAVRRDRTAANWRRKQRIYADSRLFVATPCNWLMERVAASMLDSAIVERRVIPNGVDLSVFRPGSRAAARAALGIPLDADVLLFVASGLEDNPFKDFRTLRAAVDRIGAQRQDRDILFLALGAGAPTERTGRTTIRFIPFEDDPARVALHYQAADLYLHAARADTFPGSILEALACGTPVVATAIGGIPEQVRSLAGETDAVPWTVHPDSDATGALVGPENAPSFARATLRLLENSDLRRRLAGNAARDARRRFDVELQCDAYLNWYQSIVQQ